VLFVEDDRSVAQMYKLKLELDGYRVDVASDGEMAVEMARRDLPDIIFLDIRLPKLDGIGVLQALRSNPKTKEVRVVILSNYNPREARRAPREAWSAGPPDQDRDDAGEAGVGPRTVAQGVERTRPAAPPRGGGVHPAAGPPPPELATLPLANTPAPRA